MALTFQGTHTLRDPQKLHSFMTYLEVTSVAHYSKWVTGLGQIPKQWKWTPFNGKNSTEFVTIFIPPKMPQVSVPHIITADMTDSKICWALWKQTRSHCKSRSKIYILNKACVSQDLVLMVSRFIIPFKSVTLTPFTSAKHPTGHYREGGASL